MKELKQVITTFRVVCYKTFYYCLLGGAACVSLISMNGLWFLSLLSQKNSDTDNLLGNSVTKVKALVLSGIGK